MTRYTIDISFKGQHYATINVPDGMMEDEAKQVARTFDVALRNHQATVTGTRLTASDLYIVTLRGVIENLWTVEVWA